MVFAPFPVADTRSIWTSPLQSSVLPSAPVSFISVGRISHFSFLAVSSVNVLTAAPVSMVNFIWPFCDLRVVVKLSPLFCRVRVLPSHNEESDVSDRSSSSTMFTLFC